MKILLNLLLVTCIMLLFTSCVSHCKKTQLVMEEAKELIVKGDAKCVLIKDNKIITQYRGRGVSPLLAIYKKNSNKMKDGIIVDKVIGRAAAFIIINGGVKRVYTILISETAKKLLEEYNIKTEYEKIVPEILNNQRNDLCPLEKSVLGETNPKIALDKIYKQIDILMKRKK